MPKTPETPGQSAKPVESIIPADDKDFWTLVQDAATKHKPKKSRQKSVSSEGSILDNFKKGGKVWENNKKE